MAILLTKMKKKKQNKKKKKKTNKQTNKQKTRDTCPQSFKYVTVWVDSLWKRSQILYERITDSLSDGHRFFTVLVIPIAEDWKW